ncbi:MAG: L-serine ammonia-lyase, iron-sulfur-dependent subunit beta [Anaerovibrio sp.]|uniref:L-serine ammonia-lyase, iron-sulfur-dependent subunit beta n=1 Tax=Anaerovibrio sp. TaxID=1872532 RepID=UPI0025DA8C87|nr:L-serine ammonia-lyase, iron-sulfur-dependent subunit beta [Anaerovibrio sp.]MCR5175338.1 L-serine ammonia-lyase, iron-sulfur-dependent subunit beta [Anaerovibrio sp.]
MRGVFDIVGPIMIGPSSSHTAGAARLGLMAGKILGEKVVKAEILLHGSFAQTYRGHGTDKALIGGIMGFSPEDDRIRNALEIADKEGLEYSFETVDLAEAHPNTAVLKLVGDKGRKVVVGGASIGGGNIEVSRIDSFEVSLTGEYPALVVVHRDRPGVINVIASVLARYGINIAFMRVSRRTRGQQAMMIIETDDELTEEIISACRDTGAIENAFAIPAI